MLVERDRVARGATGRNAGQLTTYFERPLSDIADEFGWEQAVDAQRGFEDANDLLDLMVAESGARVRVERFTGHMGMFNRHHLEVHLRCMLDPPAGGIARPQTCVVSEDAEFLTELPTEFAALYSVVPQTRVRELLEVDDDRYRAVLSARAGCANSGCSSSRSWDTCSGSTRTGSCMPTAPMSTGSSSAKIGRRRARPWSSGDGGPRGALHEWLCRPRRRGRRRLADPARRRPADHRPGRAT